MSSNLASELTSAIQSAHIQHHPDPAFDINPSTAASANIPAIEEEQDASPPTSTDHIAEDDDDTSSISSSVVNTTIRPRPRTRSFPPLPDMRFEQSYLASISRASDHWEVAYITFRDQVMLPLTQGILWNMVIFGWRHWNRGAQFAGAGLGARFRRWWWEVNDWKLPKYGRPGDSVVGKVGPARVRVSQVEDYYVGQMGSSMGD